MSKPWGTIGPIGSWAAEAELAEAEEREMDAVTATAPTANPQSFPSLKEAVSSKPRKKKMTLSEFNTYGSSSTGSATKLTPDEKLQLPTAPKPRFEDDTGGPRLGGGFSTYGDDRRWSRGGFDDDRRPPRREFEPPPPSRADEVDNWASSKRAMPPAADSGRTSGSSSRYGSLGGGSRADEIDNWNMGKRAVQAPPPPGATGRSSSFGSGFRDSGSSWRRERESPDVGMGRPRLVLDPPSGAGGGVDPVAKANKANPFGAARPREEVLAEKGLDWKKLDMEIEEKKAASISGSRPTSSQGGSRPTSSQSNRSESVGAGVGGGEGAVRQRSKVNPFGDAKPREVLLEEKGMDWRKIEFELERKHIVRPETYEEKALKEEIENLKKELQQKESSNDASQGIGDEQTSFRDLIPVKKKELEMLTRDLDDKVRFGQKGTERPGSGAGRFTSFPDKPPSRSGSFEDSRGLESMDRPRSRGRGDAWTRPGDDWRGGFQGSRDRGFLNHRDSDRPRAAERW